MLVLKGGSTSDWESFDNPWQPIDDFQAPYREPVLPPPDFDPDTLDIGVGVPIETIIEQREREKKIRAKKNHMYDTTANVRETETGDTSSEEEIEHNVYSRVTNNINDIQAVLAPENKLKSFKEEVERSQDEFRQFLDDVSKFISDMENFHSVKQSASQSLPRSVPTPRPTTTTSTQSPSTSFTTVTPRSVSWRSNISDPSTSSPYPVSYVSPYAKVYLSTKYVSKVTTTISPLRPQVSEAPERISVNHLSGQARSTRQPQPARQTTARERSSTTSSTTSSSRSRTRDTGQQDWQPVTTARPTGRNVNREDFKSAAGPAGEESRP